MLDETLQNVPFILKYEILKFMYFFFQFVLLYFLPINAYQVSNYGKNKAQHKMKNYIDFHIPKTVGNFEAFCWIISSCINFSILEEC